MTTDDKQNLNDSQETNQPPARKLDLARRRRKRNYDGTKPLEYPELEALAEFLSTPKQFREFRTFADLAEKFDVSRMTIYRWSRDADVLLRAEFLVTINQAKGDLVARLHWDRIVLGQVRAALKGNTKAAEFCEKRAWPANPFS